mmetsp:Transcript_10183/g.25556  ORF Transcript_10183/g.25556 Transcript_10183/m.25556 type:complete len:247 (+) Transcript_10183:308-1048(+)
MVPSLLGMRVTSPRRRHQRSAMSLWSPVCTSWSYRPKNSWRRYSRPLSEFLAPIILSMRSSGSGAPVSWCELMRFKISFSQHQFSSSWEGHSTKSRSTLVPANMSNLVLPQMPCMACPNSWKNVTTSSCFSKDGADAVGLVKLHTMAATGYCLGVDTPLTRGNTAAWLYLPSRGNRSRKKCPSNTPESVSYTAYISTSGCHTGGSCTRKNVRDSSSWYRSSSARVVFSIGKYWETSSSRNWWNRSL